MKKIIFGLLLTAVSSSPAFALTISVFNAGDNTSIDNWIGGGSVTVLEDFETQNSGWSQSLETNVGEFKTVDSNPGKGATSYNGVNHTNSSDPYFSIQDRDEEWYGRYNTTLDTPGYDASKWLDSGDIDKLTLDVDPTTLTNLFFYMQDPSDVGATTKVGTNVNTYFAQFNKESDASSFFVGIKLDAGETLSQITWTTSTRGDGYGLDDFSTVAPVPEPTTMILFGAGLAGLAFTSRRKKS